MTVLDNLQTIASTLWPLIYTAAGVGLGVYLNGLIEIEREREKNLLKPLLREVSEVSRQEQPAVLAPLVNEQGEIESILRDVPMTEMYDVEQTLFEYIHQYLGVLGRLQRLGVRHIPIAEALVDAGYETIFEEEMDSDLLITDSEGVDPTGRPQFPGPSLRVGEHTVEMSQSDYFETGPAAPVRTAKKFPLFALLLENLSALRTAERPSDLRVIVESVDGVQVDVLDGISEGWENQLWTALQRPWHTEGPDTENGGIALSEYPKLVDGENFIEVVETAEQVVQGRRNNAKGELLAVSNDLRSYLITRTTMFRFHPKRLRFVLGSKSGEPPESLVKNQHRQKTQATRNADT